jgi:outer membrane protein assembly factor BamB
MKIPVLSAFFAVAFSSTAADWPQFRGPNGAGVAAADANPPIEWTSTRNLAWRARLPGPGTSSPIVTGGRVFVTCYSGHGDGSNGAMRDLQRHLVCADLESGKILWTQNVPAAQPEDQYDGFLTEHGYASNTPVTDGERVYAFFSKSGVHAFDLEGEKLWQVEVGRMSNNRRWGSGASLMLHGEHVIVNAADEGRKIVALDRQTGKEVWSSPASALELAFGTPILVTDGGREDLVIGVAEELWGINPANGKLRWLAETGIPGNVSPTVVQGDGRIYVFGGFPRRASVAVRTGGKGDVSGSHVAWRISKTTYVPTPVYHDGHLYFVNDQGFALCVNAGNGDVVYEERVGAGSEGRRGGRPFYASAVLAGDRYYAISRKGGAYVIAAKPHFKVLAHNVIADDDSQFNATPAVFGGSILLRSDKALYRFSR